MRLFNKILLQVFILTCINIYSFNSAYAVEITVATIREMIPLVEEVASAYEKEHPGDSITIMHLRETNLLTHLAEPYSTIDILITDNLKLTETLAESNLIVKDSLRKLGSDKLCVIVKKNTLMRPFFLYPETSVTNAILVSNPSYTAMGQYTKQALTKLNLWLKLSKKLAFFDNNNAIANTVARGHYDGGIIYCSFARNHFVQITDILSPSLHDPIQYTAGITEKSKDKNAVKMFLSFLTSEKAKEIYKKYHFYP